MIRRVLSIAVLAACAAVGASAGFADELPPANETSLAAAPEAPATSVDSPPLEAEANAATTGWFRVDTDGLSTQFWFGATHDLGGVAIASDIYVVGSFAELDIGPAFAFGKLAITPMIGLGFDFSMKDVTSLIAPQLFTIYDHDKIYFESWIQLFVNSLFADDADDSLYTRNFLLYKVADELHLGPAMELTYRTNTNAMTMADRTVLSLPVGATASVGYGDKNRLLVFLGYDTKDQPGSDNISGRFSFIRTW